MGKPFYRFARNALLGIFVILVVGALGGAAWYYKASQIPEPIAPQKPSPAKRPGTAIAVIALDPSRQPTPVESPSPDEEFDARPQVRIFVRPLQHFSDDLKRDLVKELSLMYPEASHLGREGQSEDSGFRAAAFQFLDIAEKTPGPQQPALLLAADYLLARVGCPEGQTEQCELVRKQFATRDLTFRYVGLDGGSYYDHDLLWRVWKDYPATDWGERAFVLLLGAGFDPSAVCTKGSDEFRDVIREGESFLQTHPGSAYRAAVMHAVGQAYATWWSLASTRRAGNEDFVDPKAYQQGSEEARQKAISYFEQVLEVAPGTQLGEYSRQVLPALREKHMTTDSYQFYCVGD